MQNNISREELIMAENGMHGETGKLQFEVHMLSTCRSKSVAGRPNQLYRSYIAVINSIAEKLIKSTDIIMHRHKTAVHVVH
jgi:hypothetical protein